MEEFEPENMLHDLQLLMIEVVSHPDGSAPLLGFTSSDGLRVGVAEHLPD